MEFLKIIALAIIQGLTEFLPVSSGGLSLLAGKLMGYDINVAVYISAMLHIGTLFAIVLVFRKNLYELFAEAGNCIRDAAKGRFTLNFYEISPTRKMLFMLMVSCLPLLLFLIPFNGVIDSLSLTNLLFIEAICFLISGFVLTLGFVLSGKKQNYKNMNIIFAAAMGIAQVLCVFFPCLSRFALTTGIGLSFKLPKSFVVKYSFIMSIPAIFMNCLFTFRGISEADVVIPVFPIIVGVIFSAVIGVFTVKILNYLLDKNKLNLFGILNTVLGVILTVTAVLLK